MLNKSAAPDLYDGTSGLAKAALDCCHSLWAVLGLLAASSSQVGSVPTRRFIALDRPTTPFFISPATAQILSACQLLR